MTIFLPAHPERDFSTSERRTCVHLKNLERGKEETLLSSSTHLIFDTPADFFDTEPPVEPGNQFYTGNQLVSPPKTSIFIDKTELPTLSKGRGQAWTPSWFKHGNKPIPESTLRPPYPTSSLGPTSFLWPLILKKFTFLTHQVFFYNSYFIHSHTINL